YIRDDIKGAHTLNIDVYSNLTDLQLERHKDWLTELKRRNQYIEYTPHQVDIWQDGWGVSFTDGVLKAKVTETYHTTYKVIQDGVVLEEKRVADRWIHYLRFDKELGKWLIYQNEVPDEWTPPHGIERSFGF
ncbi:MAG TPA: hypothetical protein GX717_02785, partial [Clostridiaceae bacterium]|nr:hypothetical protein [Clostridiaceae bacterium]